MFGRADEGQTARLDTNTAQILLRRAAEALRQGRHAQAQRFLAEFRPGDPLYAVHLQLQGAVNQALGHPAEAAQLFRQALHETQDSPESLPGLLQAAATAGLKDESFYADCFSVLTSHPREKVLPMLEPVLDALSFNKRSTFEWNAIIYRTIALPLLQWCISHDHLDEALFLESRIYAHVKQRETESHFRECFAQWTASLYEAGRRHDQGATRLYGTGREIRVGLLLESLAPLIHVHGTLKILQGLRASGNHDLQPVIYCFSGRTPEPNARTLLDAFRAIDVPVVMLEEEYPATADKRFSRLLQLSRRLAEDRIDVLIWVSLALMMPLAFGMRIAPVQIWFSMKYHSIECPGIDRYLTRMGFSRTRRVNNRTWDNLPPGMDNWPVDPALRAAAQAIRDRFPGQVLLGTFGREEKLVDPAFLASIARILAENPDAAFLYTGRRNHPVIVAALSTNSSFADRVHFIGWVDTHLYANAIDIFLDSFPFPCGITAAEAMSVGVPLVMRDTPESRETGLPGHILPVIENREGTDEERARIAAIFGGHDLPLMCLARSDDEYAALASRLVNDLAFRSRAGAACREFVDEFLTGVEKMGQALAEHIRNAVAARRAAERSEGQP